mmetsp:Transcript_80937/g.153034  ORF Transcript_80937/g.153034 Transcript_80937/m.153034 type:complete len:240 (-) Transcript_80937:2043-2762(-)
MDGVPEANWTQPPGFHKHNLQLPAHQLLLQLRRHLNQPWLVGVFVSHHLRRLLKMIDANTLTQCCNELLHLLLARRADMKAPLILASCSASIPRHRPSRNIEWLHRIRVFAPSSRVEIVLRRRPPLQILNACGICIVDVKSSSMHCIEKHHRHFLKNGPERRLLRRLAWLRWLRWPGLCPQERARKGIPLLRLLLPALHEAGSELHIGSAIGIAGQERHRNLPADVRQVGHHCACGRPL